MKDLLSLHRKITAALCTGLVSSVDGVLPRPLQVHYDARALQAPGNATTRGFALQPTEGQASARLAPHPRSARDIKAIIEAERAGLPFLLWRGGDGSQRLAVLREVRRVSVGRSSSCDVTLAEDGEISRAHAELELIGEEWVVVDDGLSRNGTYVNGARISGRKRLSDGDVLRIGRTVVEYRSPAENSSVMTSPAPDLPSPQSLNETQRKILIALCRPYKSGREFAAPATNNEIACEVFLSVDAVKSHLRTLFQRFEIAELPQNQKRARLVECAFQWGLISERDL